MRSFCSTALHDYHYLGSRSLQVGWEGLTGLLGSSTGVQSLRSSSAMQTDLGPQRTVAQATAAVHHART